MLKKLTYTEPAVGNVRDRIERIQNLAPEIQSSIKDAQRLINGQNYQPLQSRSSELSEEDFSDSLPKS